MSNCVIVISRTNDNKDWGLRNIVDVSPEGDRKIAVNEAWNTAALYISAWQAAEPFTDFKTEMRDRNKLFDVNGFV